MSLLSDIAQIFRGDPVLFWITLTVIPIVIWMLYKHQRPKYVAKWFLNYKIFTFATLFSIMFLVAGAIMKNYSHFASILIAGGSVCAIMLIGIVEPMLHKKQENEQLKNIKISRVWVFIGLIAGTFAVAGAWILFPNVSTREGWITFILLCIIGATFLIRAIVAFNFHIWLPTFVASFTATNAPNWINPSIGGIVTMTQSTILFITASLTIIFWVVLTLILLWLSHLESFINKTLNSPPFLFVTAVTTLVWAALMVIFQWSL